MATEGYLGEPAGNRPVSGVSNGFGGCTSHGMSPDPALHMPDARRDGYGSRRIEHDSRSGRVEVLDVSPVLATPAGEQAIRSRAARFNDGKAPMLATIHRIARAGDTLSVTTAAPEGATLEDVLGALEFGTVTISDEGMVELATVTIRAVAAMHDLPCAPTHGALTPAHVLFRREGSVLLTGALFADALQALQHNREQFWREFSVALPPSASLPRFDQRADVAQLGALVLAILLRRALTCEEYPRGIAELVNIATAKVDASAASASALRMWLQHALQLHTKATFGSAVDAARAFGEVVPEASGRRASLSASQTAIRELCGDIKPGRPPAAPAAPAQ